MNKKWMLGSLLGTFLIAMMPLASAGPAPHATVVIDPRTIYCQANPFGISVGGLTIRVLSDCTVIVDYYAHLVACSAQPRTLYLGPITIYLESDCAVTVVAQV